MCVAVLHSPSDGCGVDTYTHCSVSAVAGTHLEGETHADGAGSALLPQTDHLWPQVPPQQRHPAQRPQTRYASAYTGRNVAFAHTLASQESAGKCHAWNADGTNVFVSFRQLLCQREHGAAAGRLRPRCQAGDSGAEEKVSTLTTFFLCVVFKLRKPEALIKAGQIFKSLE